MCKEPPDFYYPFPAKKQQNFFGVSYIFKSALTYVGQLNFRLFAVDDILKTERDNPSVGLLLCKSKNGLVVEYSLKDMSKPIGVSEYQITSDLPAELEKQLSSIEDIQKHIQ